MCSKPTDPHLYLNAKSSHPKAQIVGIARGVALRLRRICSDDNDFWYRSKEYSKYLIDCGHDKEHVLRVFNETGNISRQEARNSKRKIEGRPCTFISKFNPRATDIGKIFRKHRNIIDSDERAKQVLPEGAVQVSYKRSSSIMELLAPSNPYKNRKMARKGCFVCTAKRCDCSKNFLISGASFRSTATGRSYNICKSLTCTSRDVVYLAHCATCNLQGVGSTVNFKSRLANYKSHIKYQKNM